MRRDFATRIVTVLIVTGRTAQYDRGEVVPYNEFWYERGTVISTRRTSLVVDPPDGRIPALTPEAEKKRVQAAEARRGVGADVPRWRPAGRGHSRRPLDSVSGQLTF